MKTVRWPILAALLLLLATPPQRAYVDLYEQMVVAFREGDDAAMSAAAEGALALRPRFPAMMVNLAIARIRLGESEGALDLLQEVAEMGLAYPIEESEQFAPVAASRRFQDIVARMRANSLPAGEAEVALTLPQRDFFPEGIAFDEHSGTFFVGSVRTGSVVEIIAAGDVAPFAQLGWSVLGMKLDRPRGLLWVSISGLDQRADLDSRRRGRAGIAALALSDGRLQGEYLLPDESVERVVGDLVVSDDGHVYASDSIAGGVWVLHAGADAMTPVLPDGTLVSPQGLDMGPNGTLYVADYNGGIFRVDVESGAAERLQAPDAVSLYGIDGLYVQGDGLLAVQNGISPHRVLRVRLDAGGTAVTEAKVLLRADPRFGEPTLGAVVGDAFYLLANSPWAYFADPAQPPDIDSLPPPTVLRIGLLPR